MTTMPTILVRVQLKETSQPINHEAVTTYTKGPFLCILRPDDTVVKYPVADIWRVIEDYGFHLGDNDPKDPEVLKEYPEVFPTPATTNWYPVESTWTGTASNPVDTEWKDPDTPEEEAPRGDR